MFGNTTSIPYRLRARRYASAGGYEVRVSEDARRCSVFLGYADPTDHTALKGIEGTGFMVGYESHPYLVTAAHVARTLSGSPFAIRFTANDGFGRVHEIERPRWHFHPDPTVDIACLLIDPPMWATTTTMVAKDFVDNRKIQEWEIGPGDAVYVVGLFHLHTGKRKNLPVVHAGHIALMPFDEKIPVRKSSGSGTEDVEAYLVEAHALPGASGSPVMIRPTVRTMVKDQDDNQDSLAIVEARDFLLGVWVAAWPGSPNKSLRKALKLESKTWIPVGMGLVVPAERIVDILKSDAAWDERDAMDRKEREGRAASPTFVGRAKPEPSTKDENPRHKEDFSRLVSAATKKQKPAGRT